MFSANGHREAAAHDVAEHVVRNVVDAFIRAVLFQEVDRGDDAAAGAPDARLRAAGFDAADVLVTDLHHVLELEVLDAAGGGGETENRVLRLGVQDETGGVGLRVAAHDQDLLTEVGESRESVLGRGGFADATFAVERDLTQGCHVKISFVPAAGGPFKLLSRVSRTRLANH